MLWYLVITFCCLFGLWVLFSLYGFVLGCFGFCLVILGLLMCVVGVIIILLAIDFKFYYFLLSGF